MKKYFRKSIASLIVIILTISLFVPVYAVSPGGAETIHGGIFKATGYKEIANLLSFDNAANIGVAPSYSLVTDNKKQGTGCYKVPGAAAGNFSIWATGNQLGDASSDHIDMSANYNSTDIGIGFWVKTTDITKFSTLTVQITSNGNFNDNYLLWWVQSSTVTSNNKWTYVSLSFSDAINGLANTSKSGSFNHSNINAFRMFFSNDTTGADFYFDGLNILDMKRINQFEISDPIHDAEYSISGCESAGAIDFWANGAQGTKSTSAYRTEGGNSIQCTLANGSNTIQVTPSMMASQNLADCTYAFLEFDMWIPDASKINLANFVSQICYSSSGTFNDTNNTTWWMKQIYNG